MSLHFTTQPLAGRDFAGKKVCFSACHWQSLRSAVGGARFLGVLISLYFDDLTQQDWSLLAVETQHLVAELFEMFGLPFAPNKRQQPSSSGDFLGLLHDLSGLRTTVNALLTRSWISSLLPAKEIPSDQARSPNSSAVSRSLTREFLVALHEPVSIPSKIGSIQREGSRSHRSFARLSTPSRLSSSLSRSV